MEGPIVPLEYFQQTKLQSNFTSNVPDYKMTTDSCRNNTIILTCSMYNVYFWKQLS